MGLVGPAALRGGVEGDDVRDVVPSGFVCKLDERPRKPCRSPKTYKHVGMTQRIGAKGQVVIPKDLR